MTTPTEPLDLSSEIAVAKDLSKILLDEVLNDDGVEGPARVYALAVTLNKYLTDLHKQFT
jgi:hypothetical protein